MATKIRPYHPFDKMAVLELGKQMHAEAPRYQNKLFDEGRAGAAIDGIAGAGAVFVAEDDGKLVGMIGGMVSPEFFSTEKVAYAICHYVAPAARKGLAGFRLLKAFEAWAFGPGGADESVVAPSTGVETDAVVGMYERAGYKIYAHSLVKRKPDVRS